MGEYAHLLLQSETMAVVEKRALSFTLVPQPAPPTPGICAQDEVRWLCTNIKCTMLLEGEVFLKTKTDLSCASLAALYELRSASCLRCTDTHQWSGYDMFLYFSPTCLESNWNLTCHWRRPGKTSQSKRMSMQSMLKWLTRILLT